MPLEETIACHSLQVRELSYNVHLGCTAEERSRKQEIRISVEFRFLQQPKGVLSDSLQDTICYAQVAKALGQQVASQEYNLIEKIAGEAFFILKEIAAGQAQVGLLIHKVSPPLENIKNGSVYRCGDFLL